MSGNPIFGSKNQSAAWGTGAQNQGTVGFHEPSKDMSAQDLQAMYQQPSATGYDTGRMTIGDVINKTILCVGLVAIGAAVGWFYTPLMFVGAIAGLVLGLVNSFKRTPSPALILLYSAAEGLFLGGLSSFLNKMYDGVAIQAVVATLCVAGATLALYRSGKYRVSPKLNKMFFVAMIGMIAFSLVNVVLMWTNTVDGMFGLRSAGNGVLGLIIGVIAVLLATYALVSDFTMIQDLERQGAPAIMAWRGAFGLTVTLVWMYTEILRILAILREE
ncbi:Bax inhibitor-1/YccA family membrane protein [Glutamicibacter endophyticus]|uniref:Bax inhibitor-1/YccA family protein n=1 Tax=Glutamicibacter endophyticus TaxID=1522174 RepID=UPI003AF13F1C